MYFLGVERYLYSGFIIPNADSRPQTDVAVLYIDYGNRATVPKTKLGSLPASFTATSGYAKLFNMALVTLPQVSGTSSVDLFHQLLHHLGPKENLLRLYSPLVFQDEELAAQGVQVLKEDILDKTVKLNTEYK